MIQIYKISFPDGSAYVGQTVSPLRIRLSQHKTSPVNADLFKKMNSSEYTVEVISRHRKAEAANLAEEKSIKALSKPLNVFCRGIRIRETKNGAVRGGTKTVKNYGWKTKPETRKKNKALKRYPRTENPATCSLCKRTLPASKFHTDRHRSAGISSRCKDCHKRLRESMVEARFRDKDTSEAYFEAKKQCKENPFEKTP